MQSQDGVLGRLLNSCCEALGQSWAAPGQQLPWIADRMPLYAILQRGMANQNALRCQVHLCQQWQSLQMAHI